MKRVFSLLSLLLGFAIFSSSADATPDDFYKGNTIKLLVGTSAGGAMDDWARFLAPHLGRNIPGSPDIVVQNMPWSRGQVDLPLYIRYPLLPV